MKRRTRLSRAEKGIAIVVALMAVLILSILGTSLLFTTNMESTISKNYAAEVDALFAANTGMQEGVKWAMEDAAWDPKGQWGNGILGVGGFPDMTDANKPPGSAYDGPGNVTGAAGSIYYDLGSITGNPTCTLCNEAAWADATLGEPYSLMSNAEMPWAQNGPQWDPATTYLPNGASYQLYFQGVPTGVTGPAGNGATDMSDFRTDRIRILSVGMSGTSIRGSGGSYDGSDSDRMWQDSTSYTMRRATRRVHSTFRVRDIGIWTNAFYTGGVSNLVIQGGALIRGSIHSLNMDNKGIAIEFGGNGGMRNHYNDIIATGQAAYRTLVVQRLPVPAGDPHSLESELRVRAGNIVIGSNNVSIGEASSVPAEVGDPWITAGKGPMDGAFLGTTNTPSDFVDSKGNPTSSGHYEDVKEDYDAQGFGLGFPDYNDASYTDTCGSNFTSGNPTPYDYAGYPYFLLGKRDASPMEGVYALNLTAISRFEMQSEDNSEVGWRVWANEQEIVDDNTDHPAPRRSPAGTQRPATGANAPWMDFVYAHTDADTGNPDSEQRIVGVFKHLPSADPAHENNPNVSCYLKSTGGGHGFLYIPAGASITGRPADSQEIWDFVKRNWQDAGRPAGDNMDYGNITDDELHSFFGQLITDPTNADIAAGPIVGGGVDPEYGRLIVWGVNFIGDTGPVAPNTFAGGFKEIITLGSPKPGEKRRCDVAYMGRGNFAVGDKTGAKDMDAGLHVSQLLLAYRGFPCIDILGIMAPDSIAFGGPNNPQQQGLMGAWYGAKNISINQGGHVVGSVVGFNMVIGSNGNADELTQVPAISRCLPPFMIGDWSYYVTRSINWNEH